MGKRSKGKTGRKPGDARGDADILDALGDMFKPMPPNKRSELNGIVEKLLNVSSNFVADEPATSNKLFAEFEEIWALVAKVQDLESLFNLTRRLRGPRKLHLDMLVEWLKSHGGQIDGVEPCEFQESGFGLKATKDLEKGDVVIRVPRKCFMSTETARGSTLCTLMEKDPMLQTMPNVALALHLVLEKNSPASFWEPYINALPTSYPTTVLYFTPEQFKELKGSPSFDEALKQFKYVARQYAYFYRKFQPTILKDYFTFEDYRWAVSTVMTRQNEVPCSPNDGAGADRTSNALIPFWDFCNHECRPGSELSTDYDDEGKATVCMANRAFAVNEQFTIFYGKRSNSDLLVHNGFVPKGENPHDKLRLRLGVSRNDALSEAKHEMLESLGIPPRMGGGTMFTVSQDPRPLDNLLLAFLRVLCMSTKEEVEEWKDKAKELTKDETTAQLDGKMFAYMLTRCSLLLKSYPTSLEEDEELLAKVAESDLVKVCCLRLRIAEKKILNHVKAYCSAKL